MPEKILQQGAEAIIIREKCRVTKKRICKGYRITDVDEKIRKTRTKREAKIMEKVSKLICVPQIINVNIQSNEILMQFVDGKRLSDWLDTFNSEKTQKICVEIGKSIASLHDSGIIHGDLTTSNMILQENKVFFIDFGLSFHSVRNEDKAVDLHLLRQALEAKHFLKWKEFFASVLKGYKKSKNAEAVLQQLKKVESRGRYKH